MNIFRSRRNGYAKKTSSSLPPATESKRRAFGKSRAFKSAFSLSTAAVFLLAFLLPVITVISYNTAPAFAEEKTYYVSVSDGKGNEIDFGYPITVSADAGDEIYIQLDLKVKYRQGDEEYHAASGSSFGELSDLRLFKDDYQVQIQGDAGTHTKDGLTMNQVRGMTIRLKDSDGNTVAGFQAKALDGTVIQTEAEPIYTDATSSVGVIAKFNSDGSVATTTISDGEAIEQTHTQEEIASGQAEQEINETELEDREPTRVETQQCSIWSGLMSWMLCEIVNWATGIMKQIWDNFIEPVMKFDPTFLAENGTAHSAWSSFRDIANVLFVIYLLIIIFSQVTGFGIDNYGIKKSLPRLITAALLVNLSFYICELAVDLSNILGQGIGSFISSAGGDGLNIAGYFNFASLGDKAGAAVVFATAVAAGVTWIIANPLVALTGIIGALISYIFIFVILAVRQAIIIVLVVVSPVAFICYGFPNAKNVFSRWYSLFRAMLFLYPTAALCISGGNLASRIILGSMVDSAQAATILSTPGGILTHFAVSTGNNVLLLIVAVIAEVGPYFLIPSLTRSSMKLAGNIGARIGQVGRNLGNTARDGMRNSRTGQVLQRRYDIQRGQRQAYRYHTSDARRRANSYRGIRGRATRALDNWRTRQGNVERIADTERARIAEERRQLDNANFANASFVSGTIEQARIQNDDARKRQIMWNSESYQQGKQNESLVARQADAARATLYSRDDYVESRQSQNRAVLSNEITKMYKDQFENKDINTIVADLDKIVRMTSGTQNHGEQFLAAAQTLFAMGQGDKVRDVIDGQGSAYVGNAGRFQALLADKSFRDKAAAALGGSGNVMFQEYSKHIGKNGGSAKDFHSWATSNDLADGMSLAATINKKGIGGFDKDDLKYLSGTHALDYALSSTNPDAKNVAASIVKTAAATTDTATVNAMANAFSAVSATGRQTMMKSTSGVILGHMQENVRVSIATHSDWKNELGAAIHNDPNIKSLFTATELPLYEQS